MDGHTTPYVADRKAVASPVVVTRPLYLALMAIMSLADAGDRGEAILALEALYSDPEMSALLRDLENEMF